MIEFYPTDRHCSLEEIATELGVSRERVRQIQDAALRKCRQWAMGNGYDVEDLIGTAINHASSFDGGSRHGATTRGMSLGH